MVRITTMKINLENFFKKYPENEPVLLDDDFLGAVKSICYGLKYLEISLTTFLSRSRLQTVLDCASKIMTYFQKKDMIKPLNNIHFCVYLKLSKAIVHLENVLLANFVNLDPATFGVDYMDGFLKQQYICDNYKSKLEEFKANCSEVEVQSVNEHFTSFIIEYLKLLSQITSSWSLQKMNVSLLLEVADLKILMENFHSVSNLIPESKIIPLMQKVSKLCIKKKFNLQNCSLIQSVNKDFRLETCTISYFILQYICEQLELNKLCQTSQILSMFNVENIILLTNSATSDVEFEKLYDESVKHITFKTYKKIRVIPPNKVKKCLNLLRILFDSLSDRQLQNCPFTLILLSMLSEFVMATDLDNTIIISLMDLVIGYLESCKLPPNFNAILYLLNIYQKCKSNDILKLKILDLCKSLSKNLDLSKRKQHVEEHLKVIGLEDMVEKLIIISYFLKDIEESYKSEDTDLNIMIYSFNELVVFSSQNMPTRHPQLVFPYSVSLNYSLISKNEDCLFNNLALLKDFTTIIFDDYQGIESADNIYLLKLFLRYYEDIVQSLPDNFLIKCWNYVLKPENMNLTISKRLLLLCSSKTLIQFIDDLKTETMRLIKGNEPEVHKEYYHHVAKLWSLLLKMQFTNKKKKMRKDHVNHLTFILNRTFLFHSNVIESEQGLILLLKLICLFLKVSWINTSTLVYCALRIITYIEKRSNISEVELLIEAAELLMVLYKYIHGTTKSVLGLYLTSFNNLLTRCWYFTDNLIKTDSDLNKRRQLYIPFHKLEKCSSLFRAHKRDFKIICPYFVGDQLKLISSIHHLPDDVKRHHYVIVFNLMDVCSTDEMKLLMLSIQGPTFMILKEAYEEYRSNFMFTGRL